MPAAFEVVDEGGVDPGGGAPLAVVAPAGALETAEVDDVGVGVTFLFPLFLEERTPPTTPPTTAPIMMIAITSMMILHFP